MFYEEARELLIGLEEGLMDLERRQSDRAHLDQTFRAAHSLKGAAAMVGLAAIAEFTHGIEAVLDRIRGGMLAVDSDIITTLLEARDHLATMVEAEAAKSPIPPSGELTQRLTLAAAQVRSAGLDRSGARSPPLQPCPGRSTAPVRSRPLRLPPGASPPRSSPHGPTRESARRQRAAAGKREAKRARPERRAGGRREAEEARPARKMDQAPAARPVPPETSAGGRRRA